MLRQQILLLNPPYPGQLSRDYLCPHFYKSDYAWPAMDLVAISGILSKYDLVYIDAIKEKSGAESILEQIREIDPYLIFVMVSSLSEKIDLEFIVSLKNSTNAKIAIMGDIVTFDYERLLSSMPADFLIRDFTNSSSIKAIARETFQNRLVDFSNSTPFSIGIPRHELFLKYDYYYPYSLYNHVAQVLTNYGCQHACRFCSASNLAFRVRNPDEIVLELHSLQQLGIKELYFKDFTFLTEQNRTLLVQMAENNIRMAFSCNLRLETTDINKLVMLKNAGCYLVFYGLESGVQATREAMNKNINADIIKKIIHETRKAGIETLSSFILGLPGETEIDFKQTANLIFELEPDYLSLNIFVPRHGSDIRQEYSRLTRRSENISISNVMADNGNTLLEAARKTLERKFYFRPAKLVRFIQLSFKSQFRIKMSIKLLRSMIHRTAE